MNEQNRRRVAVLGNFDGVHLGHMKLILTALAIAGEQGLTCCAWTFRKHPENVMANDIVTPIITPNDVKIDLLKRAGVDEVALEDFASVKDMEPREFVDKILIEKLNCAAAVCGFNFRFGKGAKAGAADLAALCGAKGIRLDIIPAVMVDGVVVSSSKIREFIEQGDMETAARLLGRRYSIRETVVGGRRLGRTIGLPTINQALPRHLCRPLQGVYITRTLIEGKWLPSVTNIGTRPTVDGKGENVETHIIGFDADLYGQCVEIEFVKRLRGEIKFSSLDELKRQIFADIAGAKQLFGLT